jgi:hypothetical protein
MSTANAVRVGRDEVIHQERIRSRILISTKRSAVLITLIIRAFKTIRSGLHHVTKLDKSHPKHVEVFWMGHHGIVLLK